MLYKIKESVLLNGPSLPQLVLPLKHFSSLCDHKLMDFLQARVDGHPNLILPNEGVG